MVVATSCAPHSYISVNKLKGTVMETFTSTNDLEVAKNVVKILIENNRIQLLDPLPLSLGTLVRHVGRNTIGLIVEVSNTDIFSYGYAKLLIGSNKGVSMGGSWWHNYSAFEKLSEPTHELLSLLNWYLETMDDEDADEDSESEIIEEVPDEVEET